MKIIDKGHISIDPMEKSKQERLKKAEPVSVEKSSAQGGEKVHISSEAKEVFLAKEVIAKSSPVREEKVAAYQEAVRSGTYNVSDDEIAGKILEELVLDQIL